MLKHPTRRPTQMRRITIVSGGQTGADRAALDFALEHRFPCDGWCPRGRLAEDGPIHPRYALRETPSRRYAERTEWNVRDSDATVVFTISPRLVGGTALARSCARRLGKPTLHLCRDAADDPAAAPGSLAESALDAAEKLRRFLAAHHVQRLNVAGPRASQEPRIAEFVRDVLQRALIHNG